MIIIKHTPKATLKKYKNGNYVVTANIGIPSGQMSKKKATSLFKRISK